MYGATLELVLTTFYLVQMVQVQSARAHKEGSLLKFHWQAAGCASASAITASGISESHDAFGDLCIT